MGYAFVLVKSSAATDHSEKFPKILITKPFSHKDNLLGTTLYRRQTEIKYQLIISYVILLILKHSKHTN